MTWALCWSPRRVGVNAVRTSRCPLGGTTRSWVRGAAPALGRHASRTVARSGRRPGLATTSHTSACSPSRTDVSPPCVNRTLREFAASARSTSRTVSRSPRTTQGTQRPAGAAMKATATPTNARNTARPVTAMNTLPGCARPMSCQRGTGTDASTPSSTPSVLAPSNSASARSTTRWRRVAFARAFTSSGVT